MPKIKKLNLKFEGKYTDFQIYFSEKRSFYVSNLPENFISVSKFSNRADTLDVLETQLIKKIREYENIIKTTRKVLILQFNVGSHVVMDRLGMGHYAGNSNNPLDKFHTMGFNSVNGYGFSIDYKLAFERKTGDELLYFEIWKHDDIEEEGNRSILNPSEVVIEYSEQREEFLKEIQKSMLKMMLKIMDFFNSDIKQIESFIDSGTRLLGDK